MSDFLKHYILQGNVATQLGCVGTFKNHVIANFPQSVPVNDFFNRSIGKETDKSRRLTFGPPCSV